MTFIIRILLPGQTNKRSHLAYGRWFTKDRPVPCRLLADVPQSQNDLYCAGVMSHIVGSRRQRSAGAGQKFVLNERGRVGGS
jgi:hypothetical protein